MSTPPDTSVKLSKTLTLCEYVSPRSGHFGFWLYDATRGMNLSMRAKSSTDAFVEALTYYQKRLARIEAEHAALQAKVYAFVTQFAEPADGN